MLSKSPSLLCYATKALTFDPLVVQLWINVSVACMGIVGSADDRMGNNLLSIRHLCSKRRKSSHDQLKMTLDAVPYKEKYASLDYRNSSVGWICGLRNL